MYAIRSYYAVTLGWTPGFGAKLHTVFLGDDGRIYSSRNVELTNQDLQAGGSALYSEPLYVV